MTNSIEKGFNPVHRSGDERDASGYIGVAPSIYPKKGRLYQTASLFLLGFFLCCRFLIPTLHIFQPRNAGFREDGVLPFFFLAVIIL
jgi:hypothetical protein